MVNQNSSSTLSLVKVFTFAKRACLVLGLTLLSSCLLSSFSIVMGQEEEDMFAGESLEQFLDLKIITATQFEQTTAEAPAIVSVLTEEQIRKLGVKTLYEALNYLPGVLVTESYFGYTMVNVRGILQTHYNNKVILMINGHPMRDVVNGSFHLEIVPLDSVARIEFVRGPGSVLYGTNAYSGVINVITKRGGDLTTNQAQIGIESFRSNLLTCGYGNFFTNSNFYVSVTSLTDDGYTGKVAADETGTAGTIDFENEVQSFYGSFTYKHFTFSAAYFQQEKMKFGLTPVLAYGGPNKYNGGFFDISGQFIINEEMTLTSRLRYDLVKRDFEIGHFPYDGFEGHDNAETSLDMEGDLFGAEAQISYKMAKWMTLLGGFSYEWSRSEPYLFIFEDDGSTHPFSPYIESHDTSDLSFFLQDIITFGERSNIIVGLRYNNNSDSGESFVPRLGVVYNLGENTFLKALYAEAYRSPDFFEKYVETYNVLYGDVELEPEKIRSFDVALDMTLKKKANINVDLFYLETDNIVTRVPTTDPDTTGTNAAEYTNLGGEKIYGLETSMMVRFNPETTIFFTYSYREGKNIETDEDLDFIANHTANGGVNWRAMKWLSINPNVQYVSERGYDDFENALEKTDPYTLVNLVLTIPFSYQFELDLIGQNLTDEEYYYPEYIRYNIDRTPGGPGRTFYIKGLWRF